MRRAALVVVALALMACAPPIPTTGPSACAETYARALSSSTPVLGAVACLDASEQATWRTVGVKTDSDFTQVSASLGMTSEKYVGRLSDGAYLYELFNGKSHVLLFVVLENGKVARQNVFSYVSH